MNGLSINSELSISIISFIELVEFSKGLLVPNDSSVSHYVSRMFIELLVRVKEGRCMANFILSLNLSLGVVFDLRYVFPVIFEGVGDISAFDISSRDIGI